MNGLNTNLVCEIKKKIKKKDLTLHLHKNRAMHLNHLHKTIDPKDDREHYLEQNQFQDKVTNDF